MSPEDEARMRLSLAGGDRLWRFTRVGFELWSAAGMRRQAEAVATAPARTITIPVDGEPRAFTFVQLSKHWAAANEDIVMSGRGQVPTALQSGSAS
jgi:hypothetical protein